jgi:hypothetical protein
MIGREADELIDPADYNDFLCMTTSRQCPCLYYIDGRAVCGFDGRPMRINGQIRIGCRALFRYRDQIRAGTDKDTDAIEADIKRLASRGVQVRS